MKRLIAIALLFCISYQYMVRLGIVAWYEINKDYVASTLCENRDKPQMKCCGKCYLKKQLKKTEDSSENGKQVPGKIDKSEPAVFVLNTVETTPVFYDVVLAIFHDRYKAPAGSDPLASVFHPPPVC